MSGVDVRAVVEAAPAAAALSGGLGVSASSPPSPPSPSSVELVETTGAAASVELVETAGAAASVEPPSSVEPVETTGAPASVEPVETAGAAASVEPVETSAATAVARPGPPALAAEVVVRRVERVSPSFVRATLGGPDLVDLGVDGFDTRFKLVLPGPSGELPGIPERVEDYWDRVAGLPAGVRPHVRTYTVRDVVRTPTETRLVVDLVVHEESAQHPVGPACRWALTARPGDRVQVVGPHRAGTYGGTEFDPDGRRRLLVVGDATAVPAVARILADLPPGHVGSVHLELPTPADVPDLAGPPGIEVRTCVRDGATGEQLVRCVRRHLGLDPAPVTLAGPRTSREPLADRAPSQAGPAATTSVGDRTVEEPSADDGTVDVWETPRFSAAGEPLEPAGAARSAGVGDLADTYAWIAGESSMVRTLRRTLVSELGMDRAQVAFMGYWREGVAMR